MRYDEYKDKLIEYDEWSRQQLADYLRCPVEEVGLGKTVEEKLKEFKTLRKGWVMTKPNGEEFTTVKEVTLTKRSKKAKKKTYNYEYGYVEFTLPKEWVGYSAKVILSKKVTPKLVYNRDEIDIDEFAEGVDPSDLVKLVEVKNNAEPEETPEEKQKRIEESRKRDHPDWTEEEWEEWERSCAD